MVNFFVANNHHRGAETDVNRENLVSTAPPIDPQVPEAAPHLSQIPHLQPPAFNTYGEKASIRAVRQWQHTCRQWKQRLPCAGIVKAGGSEVTGQPAWTVIGGVMKAFEIAYFSSAFPGGSGP